MHCINIHGWLITGYQEEPPLQRKKKPIPLVTTCTTKMFDDAIPLPPDDYMILGSTEKFAENVKYKDYLTKNQTRVLGRTYVVSIEIT